MKKSSRTTELTTPDLVLLSLLAERPMHGYQANQLLEFRQVRDWAGISRPQIYYSLEKLLQLKFLRVAGRRWHRAKVPSVAYLQPPLRAAPLLRGS